MSNAAPIFDLFWENSKFNRARMPVLRHRLAVDRATPQCVPQILYSGPDIPLPTPKDPLAKLMMVRTSIRTFSTKRLTLKQLGSLFHGFRMTSGNRRTLPSAGGKYPVEVFALIYRAEGDLENQVVHYGPDTHSVTKIRAAPAWEFLHDHLGLSEENTPAPAALFLFVAIDARTTAKYGERGGRFILHEAGAYAQHLHLRATQENLGTYILGGLHDDVILREIGLSPSNSKLASGMLVGVP